MSKYQVVIGYSEDYVIEADTETEAVDLAYEQHPEAEQIIEVTLLGE